MVAYYVLLNLTCEVFRFIAPSETPQMLVCVSVDITNITLQWNSIPCVQQNGPIVGYQIIYYPNTSVRERTTNRTAPNIMQFTAVGLQPQTTYIFEVNGITTLNNMQLHGPAATITIPTSQPQGISHYCSILI